MSERRDIRRWMRIAEQFAEQHPEREAWHALACMFRVIARRAVAALGEKP